VLPSMTKGEIVGRLVVVIDVNPSHGFWTARLMKVFGHEGKCTCIYNTHGWIVYIILFPVVCGTSRVLSLKFRPHRATRTPHHQHRKTVIHGTRINSTAQKRGQNYTKLAKKFKSASRP
jgi:hypothetical protein